MAGEKFLVATTQNSVHITIRNILGPGGYTFLGNCSDYVSLLRLIRSYDPDFVIIDTAIPQADMNNTLDIIDDEMLCACILIGETIDMTVSHFLMNSKVVSFCPKPLNKDVLLQTVNLADLNFKRISDLERKLKKVNESLETKKLVDKAKSILMQRDNLSENDAYERIRKKSMDSRTSMKAIAEAIIFTYEISKKKI